MQSIHNPDRFMADLRQILSQGRKRIGLLVGAGAPMSIRVDQDGNLKAGGQALIPGVDELTAVVIQSLPHAEQRNAVSAIKAELGNQTNIESLLSKIRLLKQAIGTATVHDLNASGYDALGQTICDKIGTIVGARLPAQRNSYNELVAWVSGTLRQHAVEIFTTNYDLLFEEAFEAVRVPYFDGFTGGNAPFFDPVTVAGDDLPPRWSRLWKLHGSLGWSLENETIVRGRGRTATQLIYPDHLKYDLTQKQPYSALFERLKRFILTPDTLLLTIGFSFRDSHICAVLDEALAMNASAAIFAFQYGSTDQEAPACGMALDRPNVSVYAADGAVINGIVGKWQPGELPKNWEDIRRSFWAPRSQGQESVFLLGDFASFARFCALAQATQMESNAAPVVENNPSQS
jgi:hypothetical protein